MVKFKFLPPFPVDHLPHPIVSSFILFCVDLLHLLITWLIISSLSSHKPHLLFCCVFSIIIIIIIIIIIYEFCTPALADGLSRVSEWQQVSSSLQDSSEYYCWSQQYCSLDGFDSTTDFQFFKSLLQDLRDHSERVNYNCYYLHFHVLLSFLFFLFLFSRKFQVFIYIFAFFYFHSVVHRNGKIHKKANSLFFLGLVLLL